MKNQSKRRYDNRPSGWSAAPCSLFAYMRVRHTKSPLPLKWNCLPGADRALFLGHVTCSGASRLRMKLLVFRNNRDLRNFWKKALGKGGDLGEGCRGAVNGLACEVIQFREDGSESKFMEVDQRFFCVMGLVVTHLGMEIITHESVHAGFNYAKRVNRRDLWHGAKALDEEEVCYPAGRIAAGVNKLLRESGMYDLYEKQMTRSRKANDLALAQAGAAASVAEATDTQVTQGDATPVPPPVVQQRIVLPCASCGADAAKEPAEVCWWCGHRM